MSKQLRLDVAQLTDVGRKRPHNEDNMAHVIPKDAQLMAKKGALFIVADGMGGHAAGEVASEIAVDTVSVAYYQDDNEDIAVSLLHAIKRANALIHQRAAENMLRSGMGTTCVAAVMRSNVAYIANVGDSRAYLLRGGQVRQISQDHSWVEEQLRAGLLTKEQVRLHPQRNVITRSLGTMSDIEVDLFCEELEEGDVIVLCSDGLSNMVADEELQAIVSQHMPQESVYHMVERANENGGSDNITAIVIRVLEVGWEPPTVRHPVRVGGREASEEDTAIIGRIQSQAPMFGVPMRTPSSPLPHLGATAYASENKAIPSQPNTAAEPAQRNRRNRLLYPALALLIIVLLGAASGGYYVWNYQQQQNNVDRMLAVAGAELVNTQRNSANSNPADTLVKLGQIQRELKALTPTTFTDAQRATWNKLQMDLANTTKSTILLYNQSALVTSLPCPNTSTIPVDTGNTPLASSISANDAQPLNLLTALQDEKNKTVFYLLGDDHAVYQIDANHALANKLNLAGSPQTFLIASNTQRLLALSAQIGAGGTPSSYSVSLLKATASGALQDLNDASIDPKFIKDGQTPALMTASLTDVYLVLTSTAQQNAATILDFPINSDKLEAPHTNVIGISASIVSITAFPKNQLFLLYRDGSIQNLQLGGPTPIAASVPMAHALPTPLADFAISGPVPQPTTTNPSAQGQFLAVPGASHLATGMEGAVPHLFIVDENHSRVIDLKEASSAPPATPGTTAGATPTTTPVATPGAKIPVTMDLVQQYTSSSLFSMVKGITPDPKDAILYLLAQSGPNQPTVNLISVDVSLKATCATP